jgi:RNA polymerase sigma-70 factor, ECF subfamily
VIKTPPQSQANAVAARPVNVSTANALPNVDVHNRAAGLIRAREKLVGELVRKGVGLADAEELFQSSLAQAIVNIDQLREGTRFEAWFKAILRNLTYDYFRRVKKEALLEAELELQTRELVDDLEYDFCQCITKLMAMLKPEHSEVLTYRLIEGADVRQTSSRLGISENLVKVRTYRAREEMKAKLFECCRIKTYADALDCDCEE